MSHKYYPNCWWWMRMHKQNDRQWLKIYKQNCNEEFWIKILIKDWSHSFKNRLKLAGQEPMGYSVQSAWWIGCAVKQCEPVKTGLTRWKLVNLGNELGFNHYATCSFVLQSTFYLLHSVHSGLEATSLFFLRYYFF